MVMGFAALNPSYGLSAYYQAVANAGVAAAIAKRIEHVIDRAMLAQSARPSRFIRKNI